MNLSSFPVGGFSVEDDWSQEILADGQKIASGYPPNPQSPSEARAAVVILVTLANEALDARYSKAIRQLTKAQRDVLLGVPAVGASQSGDRAGTYRALFEKGFSKGPWALEPTSAGEEVIRRLKSGDF